MVANRNSLMFGGCVVHGGGMVRLYLFYGSGKVFVPNLVPNPESGAGTCARSLAYVGCHRSFSCFLVLPKMDPSGGFAGQAKIVLAYRTWLLMMGLCAPSGDMSVCSTPGSLFGERNLDMSDGQAKVAGFWGERCDVGNWAFSFDSTGDACHMRQKGDPIGSMVEGIYELKTFEHV